MSRSRHPKPKAPLLQPHPTQGGVGDELCPSVPWHALKPSRLPPWWQEPKSLTNAVFLMSNAQWLIQDVPYLIIHHMPSITMVKTEMAMSEIQCASFEPNISLAKFTETTAWWKKMKKMKKTESVPKLMGFGGGSGTTVKYSFSTLKYIFSTILPRSDHGTITAPVSTNSFFSQLNMCLCSHAVAK